MHTKLFPWILIVLWFTIGGIEFVHDANAAEPKSDDVTKAESQTSAELATAEVALWKFRLTKEPTRELTLVTTPILRWTNPVVGRVYGTVYVVTDDGRPQAIVSPYKWFTPYTGMDIECRSLASTDIEGIRDQKSVWSTSKPGVEWKPVPGDPAVGKTAAERQRQMKQLAREFTAELLDTRAKESGDDQELRQMTQPVYHYESPTHHVLEGGVFAFVIATDPELFLVLEAVESQGTSVWRYGLARMNSDKLAVKFRNKEIWGVDRISYEVYRDPKQPFFGLVVPLK